MKRVLYSVCIGGLALALTAGAQQYNDKKPERTKAQNRTANVHAGRPANTGTIMGARHTAAPNRQRSYTAPRSNSNAAMSQNRMRAVREQNLARNEALRERNQKQEFRAQRSASATPATARDRNFAVNRTRNVEVNRARNADQFRARNGVTVNGGRNFNQTRNFAYYRGGNVRINNNFHSAAFRGQRYAVFRNYQKQWHDRGWWRSHFNRIVFVNGGWYYWNAGYWFPAWGYDPYAYYAYDGPIYAYNGFTPDQVIVDVQEQLQRDGYYGGPIDGVLGPVTREAIAAFQADNGLAVTSVIDEPTLATLGIA